MAGYTNDQAGCLKFIFPPEAHQAIKDAWHFAFNDLSNTTETGAKEWDYGIFSCMSNVPLCLAVALCPTWGTCICYRNLESMSGKSCEVSFVNAFAASSVCLGSCHYAVVRGRFRAKYGLKGSPCQDCVCGCCLSPCALCSDTNQLMVLQGIQVPYLNLKDSSPAPATKEVKSSPPASEAKEVKETTPAPEVKETTPVPEAKETAPAQPDAEPAAKQ
ncbi:hypothetical protein TSOC_010511 [Tetrabaena socialis]|uniref:Uncharacterized protein n=1 Tax=Tetrabaena socialis TaxID=47790 RepID=A0A2J7ZT28_9CHLO|nr:hypothetical protein TSOC_010511 [Tetrabaena socialis]|eukprot:PNH03426.1 hypothetical protein TSOC_010511 [Tetrabaena socialis]